MGHGRPGLNAPLIGRAAIVSGSARGIGLAITEALAGAGVNVTACDIRPEINDIGSELRARGLPVQTVVADVSSASEVRRMVDDVGPVDILINNAGAVEPTRPTDPWEKSVADFDVVVGANLRSAYLLGRAVIPGMVDRGGGDIVNVATDHIHNCGWPSPADHADAAGCPWRDRPRPPGGGPAFDLYDAAKWGLNGLTQSWASALRPYGVRVNNLCPGATDTEMLRSFLPAPPAPAVVASWFQPAQIAAVVLLLLAEGPRGRSGDNVGVWVGHPAVLPPTGPTALAGPVDPQADDRVVGVERQHGGRPGH